MEKLELKHLAPYLPYGFKARNGADTFEIIAMNKEVVFFKGGFLSIEEIQPILRPLSDLSESELLSEWNKEHNIRLRYEKKILLDIESSYYIDLIGYPLDLINQLFEYHFDVFGLIDKALAIDINQLK